MTEQLGINTTPIEEMLTKLNVESVFGKPTTEGGVMIIPVAEVNFGFGYGGGYGRGPNGNSAETSGVGEPSAPTGEGGGSGGGAGGRATPRGYLHITADGVKFEPISDVTRIPLAGILMVAWSVFWITATVRTIAKAIAQRKQASS
jgi:uncharacterized spore protein YtfJ